MPSSKQLADRSGSDDNDLGHLTDEERQRAMTRHALNTLIREYDWLRAQEAVVLDEVESVSEIVRRALRHYLDEHAYSDLLRSFADDSIRFQLAQDERRARTSKEVPDD